MYRESIPYRAFLICVTGHPSIGVIPDIVYRESIGASSRMDPRRLLAGMTERGVSFPTLFIGNLSALHLGWMPADNCGPDN